MDDKNDDNKIGLKEEDGVGVADGGLQEAFGVVGVAGNDDLEAGDVGVEGLDAPGVR